MEMLERLRAREAAGNPICVGLVGCGHMGSGMVHVTHQMPGMETVAIADIAPTRALETLHKLGFHKDQILITDRRDEAEDALRAGKRVLTEDPVLLTQLEGLDAVVEATGLTEIGARVAWTAIANRKHVIMLNVETDVTVGPLLYRQAQHAGCVYTAAFGDEPGVCKMLYNTAASLGFEVVCLGKGKNNPIDLEATPESCRAEAERRGMNPKMLSAFKDGSKTMVELAAMSNATGLVPDVPGMHGAEVDVDELSHVFVPREDGGVLSRRGCVDYSTGKVAPGVFAVVTSPDPRVRVDMKFLAMGDGPYYTLYRPYHLCNVETPISIAEAVLYGEAAIVSKEMVSEVVAVAKRHLLPGDVLGEIGMADFFGRTYTHTEACAEGAVPLGLVPGATVRLPVSKGEVLTEANLMPDQAKFVYQLRQLQDEQLGMERSRAQ
jgi:predicted homoserine dehydrogenase-like protein